MPADPALDQVLLAVLSLDDLVEAHEVVVAYLEMPRVGLLDRGQRDAFARRPLRAGAHADGRVEAVARLEPLDRYRAAGAAGGPVVQILLRRLDLGRAHRGGVDDRAYRPVVALLHD